METLSNAKYLKKKISQRMVQYFKLLLTQKLLFSLIAKSKRIKLIDKIIDSLFKIEGGYALTILTNKKLIGIRDPFGIRPSSNR